MYLAHLIVIPRKYAVLFEATHVQLWNVFTVLSFLVAPMTNFILLLRFKQSIMLLKVCVGGGEGAQGAQALPTLTE